MLQKSKTDCRQNLIDLKPEKLKEQNVAKTKLPARLISIAFQIVRCPTVCVTGWRVGCLVPTKTRNLRNFTLERARYPPIQCTLCWAFL